MSLTLAVQRPPMFVPEQAFISTALAPMARMEATIANFIVSVGEMGRLERWEKEVCDVQSDRQLPASAGQGSIYTFLNRELGSTSA